MTFALVLVLMVCPCSMMGPATQRALRVAGKKDRKTPKPTNEEALSWKRLGTTKLASS